MLHKDIFEEILQLNIGVSQSANEQMFKLLGKIFPVELHKFKSGNEHNGWIVPHDWIVKKALIEHDGKVIFDGTHHPMAVAGYSPSFTGTLSKTDLHPHIFYRDNLPTVHTFHCMNNYRPWERIWGFCVPYEQFKNWPADGIYKVTLETEYLPGEMIVGTSQHNGNSEETILFNAHTCHPCQFNDGFAGVYAILLMFNWLKSQKTKYSYRGVFGPEHLGTVHYTASLSEKELAQFKAGIFTEMVSIDNFFALQQSFNGNHIIDRVYRLLLKELDKPYREGPFRTILGNDETVWEAPGLEIPFISLSRCYESPFYYDEYHTNLDDLNLNSDEKLNECVNLFINSVKVLENDFIVKRKFKGLVALSNPKYDLYVQREEPGMRKNLSPMQLRLGEIQDQIVRYFDGNYSVFEIAERFQVSFQTMLVYINGWISKGLLEKIEITSIDYYQRTRS